ncbi:VWA domain-containing protein, partial [Desulfobulbus sp. F1]|nr:VWA domain-containing protein [Desulfobulbus sp. F1]
MSVELKKYVIELSKKAKVEIEKQALTAINAQVILVLDISKSMNPIFKNGVVQEIIERMLGLALNFDDDGYIDVILFGTNAYQLPRVSLDELENYVERVILSKYKIIEATRYATALQFIYDNYKNSSDPVFVI